MLKVDFGGAHLSYAITIKVHNLWWIGRYQLILILGYLFHFFFCWCTILKHAWGWAWILFQLSSIFFFFYFFHLNEPFKGVGALFQFLYRRLFGNWMYRFNVQYTVFSKRLYTCSANCWLHFVKMGENQSKFKELDGQLLLLIFFGIFELEFHGNTHFWLS